MVIFHDDMTSERNIIINNELSPYKIHDYIIIIRNMMTRFIYFDYMKIRYSRNICVYGPKSFFLNSCFFKKTYTQSDLTTHVFLLVRVYRVSLT